MRRTWLWLTNLSTLSCYLWSATCRPNDNQEGGLGFKPALPLVYFESG